MEKGRIIFLNGVTSAGKTSIVEALQEREDVFFYVVANDLFQEMVGEKYLQENYWKYLSEVVIMMYHTAKLYSDMGKNVVIDGILVEREEIKPHYKQLLEIMKDNPLDIVEVYCPLEICRQRNSQCVSTAGDLRTHQRGFGVEDICIDFFQIIPPHIVIAIAGSSGKTGSRNAVLLHSRNHLRLIMFSDLINLRKPFF